MNFVNRVVFGFGGYGVSGEAMKLNRPLLFGFFVLAVFATPAFAQPAFAQDEVLRIGKVAVFDIQVEGISLSPDVVRNATTILTSGVTASGAYVSVASSRIEEEIVKKKVESHADACDKSCQIELGQKLSADKILHSLFLKEGNLCSLNLDLYDLAGEIQEKAVMIYGVPCTESDLFVAVRQGGALLSGPSGSFRYEGSVSSTETKAGGGTVSHGLNIDRGETIVNVQTDEMGLLFVETNPPNANLQINGESVGTSPYQGQLMVGRYVIVADLGAYYHPARQEIQLTTDGATVSLRLPPAFGSLTVTSSPTGAEVLVDGKPVGKTPYVDQRLLSGSYDVEVRRSLYRPERRRVIVTDGAASTEHFQLSEDFGKLILKTDPPGAAISLDGKAIDGVTPVALKPVKTGTHVVTFELPGYGRRTETVRVDPGASPELNVKLDPKYGTLMVMTQGVQDGKPCRGPVKIDGAEVGMTPWKGQVLAVEHRVEADCGGRSATRKVMVGHNEKMTITMDVEVPETNAAAVQPSGPSVVPLETHQVDVQKAVKKDDKYAFLDARRTRVSFQGRLSGGLDLSRATNGVGGLVQIGLGTGRWFDIHTGVGFPGYAWVTDFEVNVWPYGRFVPTVAARLSLGFHPDHNAHGFDFMVGVEAWATSWLAFYMKIGVGYSWNLTHDVSGVYVPGWLGVEFRY